MATPRTWRRLLVVLGAMTLNFSNAEYGSGGRRKSFGLERWWPFEICPLGTNVTNAAALEQMLVNGNNNNNDESTCGEPKIIGQHIALSTAPYVISEHLKNPSPTKPLVVSFVGPPGVGKTMMETRLRKVLFQGSNSDGFGQGIHVISGVDIRDQPEAEAGSQILDDIARQVYRCSRSLIVIDEVQFLPKGVLNYLVDLLGHRQPVKTQRFGNVDFRHCIFLLTSNEGSSQIIQKTAETTERNALVYDDFSDALKTRLEQREFWLAYKNRVDYYIPFLPMGSHEVKEAVEAELNRFKCMETRQKSFQDLVWDDAVVDVLVSKEINEDDYFSTNGLSHIREPTLFIQVFGPIARALRSLSKDVAAKSKISLHVKDNNDNKKISVSVDGPNHNDKDTGSSDKTEL